MNYPQTASSQALRLATFRRQMADFARGQRLRELREKRMLSQEDAAHEIGVSVKTVRTWEKGGGIRAANAKAAASFYGVEPQTLVRHELTGEPAEEADLAAQVRRTYSEIAELRGELSAVRTALSRVESLLQRDGHGRAETGS